ncbi:hypothetical protein X777_12289, partial [Ooceraea biroi]
CIQGHAELLSQFPESKREVIPYFQGNQIDIHEEIYQTTLDFMAEWLEELEPCVSPIRAVDQCNSFKADYSSFSLNHLPPIQLSPFSVKAHEWETFRDRFDALIIQNHELNDFACMHFLAPSLTGLVRNTIAGFPITAHNFTVAWKALTERFENKRKLVETYLLFVTYQPPIVSLHSNCIRSGIRRNKTYPPLSVLIGLVKKC